MNQLTLIILGLLFPWSDAFQNVALRPTLISSEKTATSYPSEFSTSNPKKKSGGAERVFYDNKISPFFRNAHFDTIRATGLKNVHTAGGGVFMFGIQSAKKLVKKAKALPQDIQTMTWKDVKPVKRIKDLHGPVTYLFLSLLFGKKYPSMFKNMFYWLWIAFCIKWYRARYVFKIPVWDRQPNWNNIITSKEQEKDLKAYTCKKCGSTLFIAKSREFFFEGSTGIGGLGCFACGVKGAENFVMDRDRIVEDVADIDDYFEYERPLDFISAAERRKVLKEVGGDEDAANKLLAERENAKASKESQDLAEAVVNGATGTMDDGSDNAPIGNADVESEAAEDEEIHENNNEPDIDESSTGPKKVTGSTLSSSTDEDDEMDLLDMDSF
mmetsp:Transcript_13714/g.32123  ORF Transcript_13714/g.32123 Transcript_13714/m.32123 type:complete len:384 (+) Transcript_13714:223-1374(+)|eukprot:CAMPEP_0197177224 /NCGR_PEP_ID=MMETSP1423-20130617/2915_1 /TAXON_ID=476441 /ORGANISM="Pseudo-nitzschia heimii, Strain UNC1101" /LENGTH=383 /DNA_ID=CAMNT_0042626747 /DNA_START=223 /DNA_END=1374 /DNA_ORIENTATION=-